MTDIPNIEETFAFTKVLFFGRTLAEYEQMFSFNPSDWLGTRVLDCPGGPASFTAEASALGIKAVACDPLYCQPIDELKERIEREIPECLERQSKVRHLFDPDKQPGYPEQKLQAFRKFLTDLNTPAIPSRYIPGSLPNLPFPDNSFDLALSGNFLFLYSDYSEGGMLIDSPFTYEFHLNAILEFLRVALELRIYPVTGPHQYPYPFLERLLGELRDRGHRADLVPVPYRDVIHAHHMLVVKR